MGNFHCDILVVFANANAAEGMYVTVPKSFQEDCCQVTKGS
jgi:hypothetical protein